MCSSKMLHIYLNYECCAEETQRRQKKLYNVYMRSMFYRIYEWHFSMLLLARSLPHPFPSSISFISHHIHFLNHTATFFPVNGLFPIFFFFLFCFVCASFNFHRPFYQLQLWVCFSFILFFEMKSQAEILYKRFICTLQMTIGEQLMHSNQIHCPCPCVLFLVLHILSSGLFSCFPLAHSICLLDFLCVIVLISSTPFFSISLNSWTMHYPSISKINIIVHVNVYECIAHSLCMCVFVGQIFDLENVLNRKY